MIGKNYHGDCHRNRGMVWLFWHVSFRQWVRSLFKKPQASEQQVNIDKINKTNRD